MDDPTLPREVTAGGGRPALSDEEADALVRDEERSHPISAVLPRRNPTLVGVEPEPESPRTPFVDEPANAEPLEATPRVAEVEVELVAPPMPRSRGVAVVLVTFTLCAAVITAALLLAGRIDLPSSSAAGTLRQVRRGHRTDSLRDERGTRVDALPKSDLRHR